MQVADKKIIKALKVCAKISRDIGFTINLSNLSLDSIPEKLLEISKTNAKFGILLYNNNISDMSKLICVKDNISYLIIKNNPPQVNFPEELEKFVLGDLERYEIIITRLTRENEMLKEKVKNIT